MEQERRAIRVRRRRRETEDTNLSGVWDSDHLLCEYACIHTEREGGKKHRGKERGHVKEAL